MDGIEHRIRAVALLAGIGLLAGCRNGTVQPVGKMTGAHTRLVWVQDMGDGTDTFCEGANLRLMAYDSLSRKRPRVLRPGPASYHRPLLSPDGNRVVYTDFLAQQIFVVDWDGEGLRGLGAGTATDVWRDPDTGRVWVYAVHEIIPGRNRWARIVRFPLDEPAARETVWDQTGVTADNLQVSADGTRIGGLYPWPHGGTLLVPEQRWEKLARGCWTSLAPDNSYLFWVFDRAHRNVYVSSHTGVAQRGIAINGAPGVDGWEVYHPRWSNHPRYFVLTGPYVEGGGSNRIRAGGRGVEVYVGRFTAAMDGVDAWARITDNESADFYPDLWIQDGDTVALDLAAVRP